MATLSTRFALSPAPAGQSRGVWQSLGVLADGAVVQAQSPGGSVHFCRTDGSTPAQDSAAYVAIAHDTAPPRADGTSTVWARSERGPGSSVVVY